MTPDAHPCDINFHINCDRLGMVDPKKGQEAFDKALKAARLFVAAPDLLALALRLVETATICRDCEWDVQKHELIQLLTGLESEAKEAVTQAQGGAK